MDRQRSAPKSTQSNRCYRWTSRERFFPRIHDKGVVDGNDVEILDSFLTELVEAREEPGEMLFRTCPGKSCWHATDVNILSKGLHDDTFPGTNFFLEVNSIGRTLFHDGDRRDSVVSGFGMQGHFSPRTSNAAREVWKPDALMDATTGVFRVNLLVN